MTYILSNIPLSLSQGNLHISTIRHNSIGFFFVSRRIIGPILTLLLVIGVGAAIYLSAIEQFDAMSVEEFRGVSGSEKLHFFRDERTVAALK
jgi:hypothetical protein